MDNFEDFFAPAMSDLIDDYLTEKDALYYVADAERKALASELIAAVSKDVLYTAAVKAAQMVWERHSVKTRLDRLLFEARHKQAGDT